MDTIFSEIRDGCELRVPSGIHHITEPIRISGSHIRIRGEDGAVLSGTKRLSDMRWTEMEDGLYAARVATPVDGLVIGTHRYQMARYPKATDPNAVFSGYAADCLDPARTSKYADPTGGYIHALHRHLWGGYSYRITGKAADGSLLYEGGWQNNRQMGMHPEYRYIENILAECTDPGEFVYQNGTLYVRPLLGDHPADGEAIVNGQFFLFENCADVVLENLVFAHSSRTFMETSEPLLRSDWTIYRGGAVVFRNCADCTVDRCAFMDVGSNGVFVDGRNRNVEITRCRFDGLGASGVCFVGRTESVRSPLSEYNETHTLAEIDKTPGPANDLYPAYCAVRDCLITRTGQTEKQSAGVEISMAFGTTVENCTICHVPRAGINISEGTFGGHTIIGCDVFDTVRETGDHGSFNSWGRDRYWHLSDVSDADAGVFAALDVLAKNRILRNRFRCDHGWDIDLDDGSSFYEIAENLCLSGGIKLREGFSRTVCHNITVGNTIHFHVWYPSSGDIVEENIAFQPYAPIGMTDPWGSSVERNLLCDPNTAVYGRSADALSALSSMDRDSHVIPYCFLEPVRGDYRPLPEALQKEAILSAFAAFPTVFGVRYAPLRAIADTPVLPRVMTSPALSSRGGTRHWCGMTVKNIETDGEMSVYGTAGHSGVLVVAVPEAANGFQAGDVITSIDTHEIHTVKDLPQDILGRTVTVLRRQQSAAWRISDTFS